MAIVSAAAAWIAPAGAQEMQPAERAAQAMREPARVKAQPRETTQPGAPETRAAGTSMNHAPADNGWQWAYDGQRPSLEYRVTDDATLRLRAKSGGAGIYLNLRF